MKASLREHLVCGSTFGAMHAAASHAAGCQLVGVLGKGSERTRLLAESRGVPLFAGAESAPSPADGDGVASVALRAPALGGCSVDVAVRLMERGWDVLVEAPLGKEDVMTLAKASRDIGRVFRVANHYANLAPVAAFVRAAKVLLARGARGCCLEASSSSHTLFHALSVASAVRPGDALRLDGQPVSTGTFSMAVGSLGPLPIVLKVCNEAAAVASDFNARSAIGLNLSSPRGELSLAGAAGPLVWYPSLELEGTDECGMPLADRRRASSMVLVVAAEKAMSSWMASDWVEAVAADVAGCVAGPGNRKALAASLIQAQNWERAVSAIGFPSIVEAQAMPPVYGPELLEQG